MTWQAHYATAAGYRYWPNEELVRATAGRKFDRVLEVGCGNGANLPLLLSRSQRVTGIDSTPRAVYEAAMRFTGMANGLSVHQMDARTLNFGDASFDGVVDVMTSQHLAEVEHPALYREYRRVLQRGGWFFLFHLTELTGAKELINAADGHDYTRCAQFPTVDLICLPSPALLALHVAGAGFRVIRAGLVERWHDLTSHLKTSYAVIEAEAV